MSRTRKSACWATLSLALALTAACTDSVEEPVAATSPPSDPLPAPPADPCLRPLADYCSRRTCRSYEEMERLWGSTTVMCREPNDQVRFGTCGELRFITSSSAYGSQTLYFDRAGRVVAARWGTDAVVPGGCFDLFYGFVPDCTPVVTAELCAR